MTAAIVILAVVAVGIVGLVAFNMVINSKLKKMEQEEVAKKENALKEKLGKTEEKSEEPVEEAEEPAEEVEEKSAEENAEEPAEEVEEKPAEENAEEPAEEVKEEPVEEKAEEPAEEVKEEPAQNNEEIEKEVEDLLKDVPNADETAAAVAEPAVEEKVEEPVEEVKEEKPVVVAPIKKTKPAGRKPAEKKEKAPAPKKAPGKKAEKVEKDLADGKWVLVPDKDGYYYGKLHANNGQMILETEKYKGIAGVKSGIETIKKNIEKDNFEISVDKNDTANFKLFGSNMGLLCIGEGYSSKESALSAIESVKHFFNSVQVVSEEIEENEIKKYSIEESDKNPNGKWVIKDTEDGYFHAELKANNGQVLLVTENYKGINSLKNGLSSIMKNVVAGNFLPKKDKNENYNFKLFAENKRLLALGAGYSTLASCESAIESVMRFCDSPVINVDGSADEQ